MLSRVFQSAAGRSLLARTAPALCTTSFKQENSYRRALSSASSSSNKALLLYSGGLDTSVILHWLIQKGYDVVAFMADLGQEDDFDAARNKALGIGAKDVVIADVRNEFLTDYVWPSIQANAAYELTYLMGTALARPCISKHAINAATQHNCGVMSHGATGKGNDQVRFELSFYSLSPGVQCLAPWRQQEFLDSFQGRSDMLEYAAKHGIPVSQTKKEPWSVDSNMAHNSFEAGILEDPSLPHPQDMFRMTKDVPDTPDAPVDISVEFKNGVPVSVKAADGDEMQDPLSLFSYLNKIGGEHGIGRSDIVENRFVGLKSRGVYEAPALTILRAAHVDLEGITMDREVRRIRNALSTEFAQLCYNGFWFSPEMQFVQNCINESQKSVQGTVALRLHKGNILMRGRASPVSLYNQDLSSMDVAGGYNPLHAEGFIAVNSIRLKAWRHLLKKTGN